MVKSGHHPVVLKILLDGAAHHHLHDIVHLGHHHSLGSYLLVIYSLAIDKIFMFTRRVILVMNLSLSDSHMT